jgi:hypothetical protein
MRSARKTIEAGITMNMNVQFKSAAMLAALAIGLLARPVFAAPITTANYAIHIADPGFRISDQTYG